MKLVPLGDRVVLKQVEAEETTKSGLILTSYPSVCSGVSWLGNMEIKRLATRIEFIILFLA